jgi:exodeoxyribonuclease VIII
MSEIDDLFGTLPAVIEPPATPQLGPVAQGILDLFNAGILKGGIFTDLPAADYHALPFYSSSFLKRFKENPAGALLPFTPTKYTIRGQAGHAWILEGPDAFYSEFVVLPDDAPKKPTSKQREAKKPSDDTLSAIDWWDMFAEQAVGKTIISSEDFTIIQECDKVLKSFRPSRNKLLLKNNQPEVSIIWQDTHTGAWCKARYDLLPDANTKSIFDLKLVSDATEYGFYWKTIIGMNCYLQAGHYVKGLRVHDYDIDRFYFLGALTAEPYTPVVYYASPGLLQHGIDESERLISLCESIKKSGQPFPNYKLPAHLWDIKELDMLYLVHEAELPTKRI